MEDYTPDFSEDVQAVKGPCPVGETYAKQQIAAGTTPVLTREGPCIDVPEEERKAVARQVADKIIAVLKDTGECVRASGTH